MVQHHLEGGRPDDRLAWLRCPSARPCERHKRPYRGDPDHRKPENRPADRRQHYARQAKSEGTGNPQRYGQPPRVGSQQKPPAKGDKCDEAEGIEPNHGAAARRARPFRHAPPVPLSAISASILGKCGPIATDSSRKVSGNENIGHGDRATDGFGVALPGFGPLAPHLVGGQPQRRNQLADLLPRRQVRQGRPAAQNPLI